MNDKTFYLIVRIGQFFLWGAIIFLGFVYHDMRVQECTSDPLVFAAKQYKESYGFDFVGTGTFILPHNKVSPMVHFDSVSVTVETPKGLTYMPLEMNLSSLQEAFVKND